MKQSEIYYGTFLIELVQLSLLIWWSIITPYSRHIVLLVWIVNCELSIWLAHKQLRLADAAVTGGREANAVKDAPCGQATP